MTFVIDSHKILPSPEVTDCPVLINENRDVRPNLQFGTALTNPLVGEYTGAYGLGPFSCDLCDRNCQNARVLLSLSRVIQFEELFHIDAEPLAVGQRLDPAALDVRVDIMVDELEDFLRHPTPDDEASAPVTE